ncbi:exodeoxyribonuclease V subunit alpha [Chromobacterium sp. IIBBL 290-4]|uniref:exodeoxyribonuclease V subunit alpha n=1 Tax=Chromobacterium sp. IIBBL 290-4 TaxID=2953890 RepID=UPI0020B8B32B|nr:exodeoxyribonuclease V subunit alpha [Chromobacterium sp. IIBBL 290-4]UTH76518.1 exodeoxyribonuclease V subunit alpha [Chromobacterium sp. IIBBL 290-4]
MNTDTPLLPDQLSKLFHRLDPDADPAALALIAELSAANQAGHVCLPLAHRAELSALRACRLVGRPGEYAPLILDEAGRLYFARHWHDEDCLSKGLLNLARPVPMADEAALADLLDRLFPGDGEADRQKMAAALAARQRLMVISGGPGTGKTTTVVRLLALLAALSPRPLVMAMAAPTGKAAARLSESVRAARDRLDVEESVRRQLPGQAETLHRLLGLRPGAEAPRHHAGNPLPLDVLVVDEASMIDLSLMARTVEALPSQARLILLGDRDQLASVEAGAVLGELCQRIAYREVTLQWLSRVCGFPVDLDEAEEAMGGGLVDCVALLTRSHRFGADSGIGALARFVNAGEVEPALAILRAEGYADVAMSAAWSDAELVGRRRGYLQAVESGASPDEVQRAFSAFMLLAAERRQVADCNQRFEAVLEERGIKQPGRDWYPGRPVMISENDYGLGLFNGDIGFTLMRRDGLRVLFPSSDGGWREFAPGRLPAHDTVFAMTVHKSQGSEYEEVWLLLPQQAGASLNRALLYTAITRARQRFAAIGADEVWREGMQRAPQRLSGLADRLR